LSLQNLDVQQGTFYMKPSYPPYKNKWNVLVKYFLLFLPKIKTIFIILTDVANITLFTKTISPPSSSAVVEALSSMTLSK